MKTYQKHRKIARSVSLDYRIINLWKDELEKFYGFNLTEEIVIKAFYFSLGQLYRMDEKTLYPLLDENGNMVNFESTMKREILIEAISLLQTGYEFPKNIQSQQYNTFFEEKLESSLANITLFNK